MNAAPVKTCAACGTRVRWWQLGRLVFVPVRPQGAGVVLDAQLCHRGLCEATWWNFTLPALLGPDRGKWPDPPERPVIR